MDNFPAFFNEKLKERGLTLQKLSELTGITIKHLESLSHGDFRNMPPAPYLRGYLVKVGKVLNFDGEACWERLEEGGLVKTSGPDDRLPQNRFSRKPIKKGIWLFVIVILVGGYFILRLPYISGQPEIHILEPELLAQEASLMSLAEDHILIKGRLSNGNQIFINNEPVPMLNDGFFEKEIFLRAGLNTIEITAKKFLGREAKTTRQLFYEPAPLSQSSSTVQ